MGGKNMKKPYFPLFIDISEKKIIVIGGGKIATRRINTLVEFADNITVAAPWASERIIELSQRKQVHWISEVYHKKIIEGADFVLAATDNAECNNHIVEDCRALKIPVNTAHKKELCDFYFPGILRLDDLVAGFCSGGENHRRVKEAREKVEQILQEN